MRLPAERWLRTELYRGVFNADGEVVHACRWTATRASLSDWRSARKRSKDAIDVLHLKLASRFPRDGDGSGADDQRDHQQGLNDTKIQGVARDEQRGDRRGNDREETKEPSHLQRFSWDDGVSSRPSYLQAIPCKSLTSCRQSRDDRAPP